VTVYLDTSAVLSRLLRQANAVEGWGRWDRAYSSFLCRVEFLRTVDRLRLESEIDDNERVQLHEQFDLFWATVHRIRLAEDVLARAGDPFPTALGTLDAIHLASALIVARTPDGRIDELLTHDEQLGRAARAVGFRVRGTSTG
jgi:predicted nucleic acid-binding protein